MLVAMPRNTICYSLIFLLFILYKIGCNFNVSFKFLPLYEFPGFYRHDHKNGSALYNHQIKFVKHEIVRTKNVYDQNHVMSSIVHKDLIRNNYHWNIECTLSREVSEFFQLKDVFIETVVFGLSTGDYWRVITSRILENPIPTKMAFEHVVFSSYGCSGFGHFYHDHLSALLKIPQWVWDLNPVIVFRFNQSFVRNAFKIFGFDKYKVVMPSKNYFIYAMNAYTARTPESYQGYGTATYKYLRKRLREYYNTTNIKPEKYYYMNKEKGWHRHFKNLDEAIGVLSNETNTTWTFIPPKYNDMKTFAATFATIKALISSSGAIAFNMLYMNEGVGMLLLMANHLDWCNVGFCYSLNNFAICQLHLDMEHWGAPGNTNITRFVQNGKKLIYFSIHHCLPEDKGNYIEALDINKICNGCKK